MVFVLNNCLYQLNSSIIVFIERSNLYYPSCRSTTSGCDASDGKEEEECEGEPCQICFHNGVYYADGEEIPTADPCNVW